MLKAKVLVIGDAMLDTFIYGDVDRVSPEAPVPVVRPVRKEFHPGGAANVACNAASLGAKVSALFLFGKDKRGYILKEELDKYGVSCDRSATSENTNTIEKTRIFGNLQQIARIDEFDEVKITDDIRVEIMESAEYLIPSQDIVVISDYGKGLCTEGVCREIIELCKKFKKHVIVDPKGTNWDKYRGADIITPNLAEINAFSGKNVPNTDADIAEAYKGITKITGIKNVLITRSEKGMTLINGNSLTHMGTQAREVYDVSGAGDTVVAALAAMLGSGKTLKEAVKIANVAAGIVVGKRGTACVTPDEIESIRKYNYSDIIFVQYGDNFDRFMSLVKKWKDMGKIIVTANGCFDILHTGHIKLLSTAKSFGDKLIVAINSDDSVKRLKGEGRPVNSEYDRANVLRAIGVVDAVVIFDPEKSPCKLSESDKSRLSEKAMKSSANAPMSLIKMISPDVHVKGGDYRREDIPEGIFAKQIEIVDLVEGYSTTQLLKKVQGNGQ